ncbi:hypothetical protein IT411_02140 [Candidatus Peregrinibacteria bacterium]|nr:hypothetical protein [Candidatus Peregrinibacteria bacterium]
MELLGLDEGFVDGFSGVNGVSAGPEPTKLQAVRNIVQAERIRALDKKRVNFFMGVKL